MKKNIFSNQQRIQNNVKLAGQNLLLGRLHQECVSGWNIKFNTPEFIGVRNGYTELCLLSFDSFWLRVFQPPCQLLQNKNTADV
ncbi:hypothetical protein DP117_00380 [Brasilonema sp. UFV-L1]|nr:hypothetical protein [Brasilonema sp. UFV-L1]